MAKLSTHIYFKARIDDFLIYPLQNMMILRKISGFTTEALETDPKYELSRKNPSKFGHMSAVCKQIRLALKEILPKQNNLAVVNSFTKKMREVLEHDSINSRGERQLAEALATQKGSRLLKGYEFNPDTTIAVDYLLTENALTVNTKEIKWPRGINHIGFRVHRLVFDFVTGENELVSGEWVMENKLVNLNLPMMPDVTGVTITVLEVQFYDYVNGSYLPMVSDTRKSVTIIEIG